jgi:xanthine dehydrogenase accessory factor
MKPEITAALFRAKAERRPLVLATRLPDGHQRVLQDGESDALWDAARLALERDKSGIVDLAGESWFLHVYSLPLRIFIVGAVHIAQALVRLTAPLDVATIVIDPRPALATNERFPEVELMLDWPDEALDLAKLDARSAIVVLTHDPKLDDPALDRALRSDAFYIGALGSSRSHAARLDRLRALGHEESSLGRIKGPVGLPIGAVTAAEIALSILAELVLVRRSGPLSWAR